MGGTAENRRAEESFLQTRLKPRAVAFSLRSPTLHVLSGPPEGANPCKNKSYHSGSACDGIRHGGERHPKRARRSD